MHSFKSSTTRPTKLISFGEKRLENGSKIPLVTPTKDVGHLIGSEFDVLVMSCKFFPTQPPTWDHAFRSPGPFFLIRELLSKFGTPFPSISKSNA